MAEPSLSRRAVLGSAAVGFAVPSPGRSAAPARRGFALIQSPAFPLGGAGARRSLRALAGTGATCVSITPFLWQARADSAAVDAGSDMSGAVLSAGIRDARRLGLDVMVKPHVWVPGGWAGQVRMGSEADWAGWFDGYARHLVALAVVAERQGARWLAVGTELQQTAARPEWRGVIRAVRGVYRGRLLYVAQGAEGAAKVAFHDALDAIGVTLYPALGADDDEAAWRRAMRREVDGLAALKRRTGKPVWVAEIGVRSAAGAAARPWESAEERAAPPDPVLQQRILAAWLDELAPFSPEGVLIWRWLSDPGGGGPRDTDFTVQGKPAAAMLRRRWR